MKYRSKEVVPLLEQMFKENGREILNSNDFRILVRDYLNGYEAECNALYDVFGTGYAGKKIYEKDAADAVEQKITVLQIIKELSQRFNETAVMFSVRAVISALGWKYARENMMSAPRLRFVGTLPHPALINVNIPEGGKFSIGRFDVSVGKRQSNFEFEKRARGVSRRHAVIEHHPNGYVLIDLSSSAGTYADGVRITPNTTFQLEHGVRVSFGASGADYIWEEYS